jgi:hypothetical protein
MFLLFQMEYEKSIRWLFCHTDEVTKSLSLHYTILYTTFLLQSDALVQASLMIDQWKSGCPVEVRHRCHIRLFGSTNLVDLMTSGIGK